MRSLARGLNVIDFIARNEGVTFTSISEGTGLSKATTNRILSELVRSGFVWRAQEDRKYHSGPLIAANVSSSYAKLLQSAASQPLQWLVERIKWPSDVFALEGTEMVMVESNRPASPFHLRWSRIGRRVPLLLSSVGRAVLAEMSTHDADALLSRLRDSGDLKLQERWLSCPVEQIIAATRAQGYGVREPAYAGPVLERSGETSIGVAIHVRNTVLGGVNVWWPESADVFPQKILRDLLTCRDMIEDRLKALPSTDMSSTAG